MATYKVKDFCDSQFNLPYSMKHRRDKTFKTFKLFVDLELQENWWLPADHTNNSSLFQLTSTYNSWRIKFWRIANCLPNPLKFCAVE